jgi:hypothetical protein
MNAFLANILELLKSDVFKRFASNVAQSLLNLLIEWVAGLIRTRSAAPLATAA